MLSLLGRAIRLPLRLIPPDTIIRVIRGPMRGKKWIVGSGLHRTWLGTFERAMQRQFVETLHPGMTVYDIGAHAGVYTIPASLRVGKTGRVVAFEPVPRNVDFLQRHISLNHIVNVDVMPVAVGATASLVHFAEGTNHYTGHVAETGAYDVEQTTLDAYACDTGHRAPDVIKIDVEGSELAVLQGASRLMAEHRPVIFLSTHSSESRRVCLALLDERGYIATPINGNQNELLARAAQ